MPFAPPKLFFLRVLSRSLRLDSGNRDTGIGITTTIINEMEMDNGD